MWNRISGKANASSETLDRSSRRSRNDDEEKERKSDTASSASRPSKSRGGKGSVYEDQDLRNGEGSISGSRGHGRDRAMSISSGKDERRGQTRAMSLEEEDPQDQARPESKSGRRKSSGGSKRDKDESKKSKKGDRSLKRDDEPTLDRDGSPNGQFPVSAHAQDQFPGQLSSQTSAVYRPPLAVSEGGPGLAADYYGDAGESVAQQPGNRTHSPSLIIGAEPHLMAASSVEAPPPEPSHFGETGAAASFYSGEFDDVSTVPSKPADSSSYHDAPIRPQQGPHSSSAPIVPTLGTAAIGAAAGYLLGGGDSIQSSRPQNGRPSSNGQTASITSTHVSGSTWQDSNVASGQASSLGPTSMHNGTPGRKDRHDHGPLGALVNFVKDPDGVAQYEEYTEFIGICKGCFDPGSSPRDAPRRHRHSRRRSDKRLGHSTRIEKQRRHSSSSSSSSDDETRRRKNNSWFGVGAASLGLAKMGETLFKQRNDFDDTYDVKSGRFSPSRQHFPNQDVDAWTHQDSKPGISNNVQEKILVGQSLVTLPKRPIHDSPKSHKSDKHRDRTRSRRSASPTALGYDKHSSHVASHDQGTRHDSKKKHTRRKRHSKKKEGIFSLLSPSSSSSSLNVHSSPAKHSNKDRFGPDKKITSNREAEAALLGLGAATAALALSDSRAEKKAKNDRAPISHTAATSKPNKIKKSHPASSSDEIWESASEGERSDHDSNLAFGSPSRQSSHESLSSLSSGTEKWNWRWGRKTKRRGSSTTAHLSHETLTHDPTAVYQSPQESPGTGSPGMKGESRLQYVYAVPTSDPSRYDVQTTQASPPKDTPIEVSNMPRSEIKQPQPRSRASAILNSSMDHEAATVSYDSDPSPANHSQSRRHGSVEEALDDARLAGPEVATGTQQYKLRRSETSPARIATTKRNDVDVPERTTLGRSDSMSVRFAMSEEQEEQDRHERRARRKAEKEAAKAEKSQRRKSKDDSQSIIEASTKADDSRTGGSSEAWTAAAAGLAGAAVGAVAASHSSDNVADLEETREQQRRRRRRDRERGDEADLPLDRKVHGYESSQIDHRSDSPTSRDDSVWKEAARSQRPQHEDYQTFFAPIDVLTSSSKKPKTSNPDPNGDVELGDPNVIEITPNFLITRPDEPEFSPADERNTSYDDHNLDLPWQVPRLKLVQPTPPASRPSSPLPEQTSTTDSAEADVEPRTQPPQPANPHQDVSRATFDDDTSPAQTNGVEDHERTNSVRATKHEAQDVGDKSPVKTESSNNDDYDFAATLAASAQDAGFDPSIVIDNPTFHRRVSPPRSDDVKLQESSEDEKRSKKKKKDKKKRKSSLVSSTSTKDTPPSRYEEPLEDPYVDARTSNDAGSAVNVGRERGARKGKSRKASLKGEEAREISQAASDNISVQSRQGKTKKPGRKDSESKESQKNPESKLVDHSFDDHGEKTENDILEDTHDSHETNPTDGIDSAHFDRRKDRSAISQEPIPSSESFLDRRPKPPRPPDNAEQSSDGEHPPDDPRQLAYATNNDASRSVSTMDSPTAVPVSFRRPGAPASKRSSSQSPMSSPRMPHDFKPQPKVRPRSTEFKTSKEIRPLWLVERHSSRQEPSEPETYPPLPESQSTSAASSIHDPLDVVNDSDWHVRPPPPEVSGIQLTGNASDDTGLLGSEEPTPTGTTFKFQDVASTTGSWSQEQPKYPQYDRSDSITEATSDIILDTSRIVEDQGGLNLNQVDSTKDSSQSSQKRSEAHQEIPELHIGSKEDYGIASRDVASSELNLGEKRPSRDQIGGEVRPKAISRDMTQEEIVANMISVASTEGQMKNSESDTLSHQQHAPVSEILVPSDQAGPEENSLPVIDAQLDSIVAMQNDPIKAGDSAHEHSPRQAETIEDQLLDDDEEARPAVSKANTSKGKKAKKDRKAKKSAQSKNVSAIAENVAETTDESSQDLGPTPSLPIDETRGFREDETSQSNPEVNARNDASPLKIDGKPEEEDEEPRDVSILEGKVNYQDEPDDQDIGFPPTSKKKAKKQKRKKLYPLDSEPSLQPSSEPIARYSKVSDTNDAPSSDGILPSSNTGISQERKNPPDAGLVSGYVAEATEVTDTAVEGRLMDKLQKDTFHAVETVSENAKSCPAQESKENFDDAGIQHGHDQLQHLPVSEEHPTPPNVSEAVPASSHRSFGISDVHTQNQHSISSLPVSDDVVRVAIDEETKPSSIAQASFEQETSGKSGKKGKKKQKKSKRVSFDYDVADCDDPGESIPQESSKSLTREGDRPRTTTTSHDVESSWASSDDVTSKLQERNTLNTENSMASLAKDSGEATGTPLRGVDEGQNVSEYFDQQNTPAGSLGDDALDVALSKHDSTPTPAAAPNRLSRMSEDECGNEDGTSPLSARNIQTSLDEERPTETESTPSEVRTQKSGEGATDAEIPRLHRSDDTTEVQEDVTAFPSLNSSSKKKKKKGKKFKAIYEVEEERAAESKVDEKVASQTPGDQYRHGTVSERTVQEPEQAVESGLQTERAIDTTPSRDQQQERPNLISHVAAQAGGLETNQNTPLAPRDQALVDAYAEEASVSRPKERAPDAGERSDGEIEESHAASLFAASSADDGNFAVRQSRPEPSSIDKKSIDFTNANERASQEISSSFSEHPQNQKSGLRDDRDQFEISPYQSPPRNERSKSTDVGRSQQEVSRQSNQGLQESSLPDEPTTEEASIRNSTQNTTTGIDIVPTSPTDPLVNNIETEDMDQVADVQLRHSLSDGPNATTFVLPYTLSDRKPSIYQAGEGHTPTGDPTPQFVEPEMSRRSQSKDDLADNTWVAPKSEQMAFDHEKVKGEDVGEPESLPVDTPLSAGSIEPMDPEAQRLYNEEYERELRKLLKDENTGNVEITSPGPVRKSSNVDKDVDSSPVMHPKGAMSDVEPANVSTEERGLELRSEGPTSKDPPGAYLVDDGPESVTGMPEGGGEEVYSVNVENPKTQSSNFAAQTSDPGRDRAATPPTTRKTSLLPKGNFFPKQVDLDDDLPPDVDTNTPGTDIKDHSSVAASQASIVEGQQGLAGQLEAVTQPDATVAGTAANMEGAEAVDSMWDLTSAKKGRKGKKAKKNKAFMNFGSLDPEEVIAGPEASESTDIKAPEPGRTGPIEEKVDNEMADTIGDAPPKTKGKEGKKAKKKKAAVYSQTISWDEPSSQEQPHVARRKETEDLDISGASGRLEAVAPATNAPDAEIDPAKSPPELPSRKQSKKEKKKSKKRESQALPVDTSSGPAEYQVNETGRDVAELQVLESLDQLRPTHDDLAMKHEAQHEGHVDAEAAMDDGFAPNIVDAEQQASERSRQNASEDDTSEQNIIDGYISGISRQNTMTEDELIDSYKNSTMDTYNAPEQREDFPKPEVPFPDRMAERNGEVYGQEHSMLETQSRHRSSSRSLGNEKHRSDLVSDPVKRHSRSQEVGEVQRKPSPVDSTTKDRSSALFDSSPSGRNQSGAVLDAKTVDTIVKPEESPLQRKAPSVPSQTEASWSFDRLEHHNNDTDQLEGDRPSLFGGAKAEQDEPQGHKDTRSISSSRDDDFALDAATSLPYTTKVRTTSDKGHDDGAVRLGQQGHERKERRTSRHSNNSGAASMESIRAFIRTPEHVRSPSGQSFRSSATPPLRRTDRSVSSDLRAASKKTGGGSGGDSAKSDTSGKITLAAAADLDQHVVPYASSSTYDPVKHKGKSKSISTEDMADYEGWGDVRGESPMSPTRPPSLRKLQSTQFSEMEQRLAMLVSDNRLLQSARSKAERRLEEQADDHHQQRRNYEDALQEHKAYVEERDATLRQLNFVVEGLREQVAQLSEANKELLQAKSSAHREDDPDWQDANRELSDLRLEHNRFRSEHDTIVAAAVSSAHDAKDRELLQLQEELENAKEEIQRLKQKILASQSSEDIVERDDDYFDQKCQELFKHLTSWVIRFSKLSDNRRCYLAGEMRNDAHRDIFEDAMLDGSEVDDYLQDRQKRRDVFTSVVMTLIFKHIFARYLFGMDREHRQKLKALDKTLQDVGPPSAVHKWRATTLKLLSQRPSFASQRDAEAQGVVDDIWDTLSTALPLPSNSQTEQSKESLSRIVNLAIDLSIDMRLQRVEYSMLPPPEPEFDPDSGDITNRLEFDAQSMNNSGPSSETSETLEERQAQLRLVLFPLVVRVEEDGDKTVIYHAQVQVVPPKKGKTVRVLSAAGNRSEASFADGEDTVMEGGYF